MLLLFCFVVVVFSLLLAVLLHSKELAELVFILFTSFCMPCGPKSHGLTVVMKILNCIVVSFFLFPFELF